MQNKMAIRTYISIITLKIKGLNAPTKRHRLADGNKNKTHIYAVYKRPTSGTSLVEQWLRIHL